MTNRAIGYARISVEDKKNNTTSVSIDAQRAAIQTYCQLRELALHDVLIDEGVSAGTKLETRPQGRFVVEATAARRVDHVVAYKLDRLFRNAFDCLGVVQEWDKADIAMHLTSQGGTAIDTRSALGKFFLTITAGVAEMERNLISERTTAALAHKATKGERVGMLPYGWTTEFELHGRVEGLDQKRLIPNPREAPIVERIAMLYGTGLSLRRIADLLNREGVPARGTRWHASAILRILDRRSRHATTT